MSQILMKAFAFLFIIALGYVLKCIGFFKKEDFYFVSKIVLNITLPAAVITSFSEFKIDKSLIILALVGILCNVILIIAGYLSARKESGKEKAFRIINYSGYSIGSFALPFIQSFLGASGVVATCIFDSGNSVMCTGSTYSIASMAMGEENKDKISFKVFFKKLFSSTPFDTYIGMLILSILNIHLPKGITGIASVIGSSNAFIAMLMLGIGFEMHFEKKYMESIGRMLFYRYSLATLMALIFYFIIPFPYEIKKILVLLMFSPLSVACTVYTGKLKGNVELSSVLSSISIVISIIVMTGLLLYMN